MQRFPKRYAVYALAILGSAGCSATLNECRLDALRGIPEEPMQITVYDAVDLAQRLHACRSAPDGGIQ